MTKDRKGTQSYLVDIEYKYSMNYFEEWYGDCVSYACIEQESYIDLKAMMLEMISDKIKFRKFERKKMILTLKIDMLDEELEKMKYLLKENKIKFLHDFKIGEIKKYKKD